MPSLAILPDLEVAGGFDGLSGVPLDQIIHLGNDAHVQVGGLANGTDAGFPAVAMLFKLPDGRTVLFETTLALFLSAADAMQAVHGDPRT